jgi:hypothetical protein
MKRNSWKKMLLFVSIAFFITPTLVFSDAPNTGLIEAIKNQTDSVAAYSGLKNNQYVTVETIIGDIVKYALLLIGALFFALIVYGGYSWMTARGNPEQSKEARTLIIEATIGLFIVMGAWLITEYILTAALKSTQLIS